ncbi:MAG: hypothetical protein A3G59_02645 [Candidatus Taylorbacteria bacterium RIFCSPLOWO2_12_FULL_47_20]|uniref:Sortase n=2 Tax=Candidatus Tayloriibacteriota TaxID=1817919 RepID=A0A1G2P7F6_9BACT|nr:MAG: hypothetical protein A3H68_01485 [Candidatus Taylorbacteria bacterium RIFCSPLOWO2_02_FULL_46_40]OHA44294.1 MAG: hypothetical protein A3G59_02645 [Candidatus Taylorbacteria bacterium RIFCSPLOWO2_12_FULL_47_20]
MNEISQKTKELIRNLKIILSVFLLSLAVVIVTGLIPSEIDLPIFGAVREFIAGNGKTAATTSDFSGKPSEGDDQALIFNTLDPTRIVIEKIGVDVSVQNPQTRDIAELDKALLKGVVHYPGSGGPEDDSNMFLFGHSTTFRVVSNPAYKAFNNLEKLNIGDHVEVFAGNSVYLYKVTSVVLVGTDTALVEFSRGKKMLTLTTCNTFGGKSKEERIVVEAVYVSKTGL